jgi:hypothetical protein
MPTTIYDSSLITQRRRATTESGSFVSRISPWNVKGLDTSLPPINNNINPQPININVNTQPNTGYAPALGIYDQSIINTVKNGQMKFYRKNDGGCTTINNGCPCLPAPSSLPQSASS